MGAVAVETLDLRPCGNAQWHFLGFGAMALSVESGSGLRSLYGSN